MKIARDFVHLGLALLLSSALGMAQNADPVLLKAMDLKADVSVLKNAYETLHPGLYRYNSKAEIDGAFEELDHRFDHDQGVAEAFLAFSQFAAKVRCGHTQANPFNQSKALVQTLFTSSSRVPFYFVWLDRRMIVTKDFSPDHLFPAGTEIISINGVPTRRILSTLMTVARADGGNDSKRIAQLAVTGDSKYETFDIYYPLFFPTHETRFSFEVRTPGNRRIARVSVDGLTFDQRIASMKKRVDKGNSGVLFESRFLGDGSLYIKMPTWALYDSKWDWKQWLNEKVEDAVDIQAPALILDIRRNEGGNDVGNAILSHLIDTPMTLSPMRRLVRYREVPGALVPYLDTWDESFRNWGTAAVEMTEPWPTAPSEVSYFRLTRYDDDASGDVIRPAGKRFNGRVIVLIDATNSSATFQFAQNIQAHHLGILIGQPTGGSQRGINGGAFFFLRLPHSGVEMDLPLIGTFPPQTTPDAGIAPDILVIHTPSDVATGRDPELAAAHEIVLKNQPH